ncbi:hypothetical protein PGB28_14880 [Primorskyibacter aestuariivivens]|uniref:hypothetical protein n=1 Tax=Primorskyibacter aestuariivivens TaxID=1888912 RepID=UPI0023013D29|nr:hypothetical protein [Primorskyibacter aestuariivivens]MDA7429750.1 hypothetical protein [Primorskyibacter aestuariivivens]
MPRLEADFTTWLSSSPTFSSGFTQWLWNDFWLQEYLDRAVEELEFEITAESGDEGERPGTEPEDPPEDGDNPAEPEVEDDPEPEDDAVDDGRDDLIEDPEDDPVEDDPEEEPEDEEEDTGGGDDPDPAPSDTEDTEEDVGTSGYVSVPCGSFPGFFDPIGHFLSLFNDRFGGVDVIGMMTSDACQAAAPDIATQFEDEFVFIPSDPEPVTPNLDDLALSDLLPEEFDGMAPHLPVDDWFF